MALYLQSIAERAERELYFFVSLIQLTIIGLCYKMLSRLQQDCNKHLKWCDNQQNFVGKVVGIILNADFFIYKHNYDKTAIFYYYKLLYALTYFYL